MAQPTFLSDGSTPRRTDSRWFILVKWLGAVQNAHSGFAANNPRRTDTRRILIAKTDAALAGVPWAG